MRLDQNPSSLIIHTYEKSDDNEKCCWIGNFIIEIGKENVLLYDADYSMQAKTWTPFSIAGESRITFLRKESSEVINYKLKCASSKKRTPCIKVSSNSGTLPCNCRKKIRINTEDCAISDMTLKMVFDETNGEKMTKLVQISFPPLYALPKILENYIKGIGYAEIITGIEYKKSEEEPFMKRLISILIPLILHETPLNFLKYDSKGIKVVWESRKHRLALTEKYVELFKQKVLSSYALKNCNNSD
ncbi:RNA-directed RNA polymerase [Dirofilaria immitis]